MTAVLERKTTPPAFADENLRVAVAETLAKLGEQGWTRPAIREALDSLGTPLTDSAVYRAQRQGAHVREVDVWKAFFQAVDDGQVAPPEKTRKLSAKAIVEKAEQAAAVVAALGEKPNAQAMRDALAKIAELLPQPKATEPEGGDAGNGDDAGKQDGDPEDGRSED
jgi:DNA-binding FadR family transcriptional regulator